MLQNQSIGFPYGTLCQPSPFVPPFIDDIDVIIDYRPPGPAGPPGPQGPPGPPGPAFVINFADFVAVMPPDNAVAIAVGADVQFPVNGPSSNTTITRISDTSFNLAAIGSYLVQFQVSINESGQLLLTLNGVDVAYTVSGRASGTDQIIGTVIIKTNVANTILTLRNPAGNSTALTITPNAGGTQAASAHLVIVQLSNGI